MSNSNITDWLTFTSATPARKQKAYVDLPVFSYNAQGNVGDASLLVAQFNFSASRDFYLLSSVTKPSNCTFGLCIRFRVGDTVTRYKLWTDDKFILSSDAAPIYNKQLIRANFVLEVWNFGGVAPVNASIKRLFTSIQSVPSDYRAIADYALAIGAEFTNYEPVAPTLPAGVTQRWTNFSSSAALTDIISGQTLLEAGPDIAQISFNAPDANFARGFVSFPDQSNVLEGRDVSGQTWQDFTAYFVFAANPLDVSLAKNLFALGTTSSYATAGDFCNIKLGNTNVIRANGYSGATLDSVLPDTNPHILRFARKSGVSAVSRLDDDAESINSESAFSTHGMSWIFGGSTGYVSNSLSLAEILFFNGKTIASGDSEDVAVLEYLRWYHFGQVPLPMTYDAGVQWLDNAPL